jgi:hypothetical protein
MNKTTGIYLLAATLFLLISAFSPNFLPAWFWNIGLSASMVIVAVLSRRLRELLGNRRAWGFAQAGAAFLITGAIIGAPFFFWVKNLSLSGPSSPLSSASPLSPQTIHLVLLSSTMLTQAGFLCFNLSFISSGFSVIGGSVALVLQLLIITSFFHLNAMPPFMNYLLTLFWGLLLILRNY